MQHTTCTEEHPICSGGGARNLDDEWTQVSFCPFKETYMNAIVPLLWDVLPPMFIFNICSSMNRCN